MDRHAITEAVCRLVGIRSSDFDKVSAAWIQLKGCQCSAVCQSGFAEDDCFYDFHEVTLVAIIQCPSVVEDDGSSEFIEWPGEDKDRVIEEEACFSTEFSIFYVSIKPSDCEEALRLHSLTTTSEMCVSRHC